MAIGSWLLNVDVKVESGISAACAQELSLAAFEAIFNIGRTGFKFLEVHSRFLISSRSKESRKDSACRNMPQVKLVW